MSNQSNQNWKIGLGILAGAAFGYWLNSDQGRRARAEAQANAKVYGDQAVSYINEQANVVSETANEYIQQGKAVAADMANTVKNTLTSNVDEAADTAIGTVEDTETEVKKGINRARQKMKDAANGVA